MKTFSSQVNTRRPDVTVSDILTSKNDYIHRNMYDIALSKYVSYAGLDMSSYNFVEIPSSYFDSPSRVKIISNTYPYSRKIVDLSPWWGNYQFDDKMSYLKLDDEQTVETSEVVYRDYVRGYAELRSKMTGRVYRVPLKDVPADVPDVDDEKSMKHTFGYKVRNKIYGQDPYGKEG